MYELQQTSMHDSLLSICLFLLGRGDRIQAVYDRNVG